MFLLSHPLGDANRQISDLKFKLAKSEQEITALEQNVRARFEAILGRVTVMIEQVVLARTRSERLSTERRRQISRTKKGPPCISCRERVGKGRSLLGFGLL